MLNVEHITAGYGNSQVLFDMNFSVGEGQAVSLLGRNGMGKSTTISTLMGLLPTWKGQVLYEGQNIAKLAPYKVSRLGISLVPEGRRIFPSLSVHENLVATARNRGNRGHWTLNHVIELFPRLGERRKQLANTLSGGEQQMLAIGRALMTNPRLLILDEATEGLAPLIRQEIWKCLIELKALGITIIVIDKNISEMKQLLDYHYVVEKGKVVWSGAPDELAEDPTVISRYLGV